MWLISAANFVVNPPVCITVKDSNFGPHGNFEPFFFQKDLLQYYRNASFRKMNGIPHYHLLLDSAPNLGPLISRWEIHNFENCWNKSVRILEVLKLLFQQFLNVSSSQRDMSDPILGTLSNNWWSWGTVLPMRLSQTVWYVFKKVLRIANKNNSHISLKDDWTTSNRKGMLGFLLVQQIIIFSAGVASPVPFWRGWLYRTYQHFFWWETVDTYHVL